MRRPSLSVHGAQAPVGVDRLGLGLHHELEPEPFEVVAQDLGRAGVELAAQQPVRALQHDGLEAELVQRVRGLEAEQAAAGDAPRGGSRALREGAQADRVLGRAQDRGPAAPEALDRRHEAARAGGEDQPVVVQPLAGPEHDLALRRGRSRARGCSARP